MYSRPPSKEGRSNFTSSRTFSPIPTAKQDAPSGKSVAPRPVPIAVLPMTLPANVAERPSNESTVAKPFFQDIEATKHSLEGLGVGVGDGG